MRRRSETSRSERWPSRKSPPHTREPLRKPGWPDRIHAIFKRNGISQVGYVPDAGHAQLIELRHADPDMRAVVLTTEEEGIALAAGAWLGGQRAVLLMQSHRRRQLHQHAVAAARTAACRSFTLVTMRGEWAEFNPWQVPMGRHAAAVLTAAGVHVRRVDRPDDVAEMVAASAALAFDSAVPVAVLFSQRLVGAKVFAK